MINTFQIKSGLFGNFEVMDYVPTSKQQVILDTLVNNKFNIIRKSRQVGVSTALLVGVIEKMISSPGIRVCMVNHKSAMCYHTRDLLIDLFNSIGVTEFDEQNKFRVSLPNGSYVSFITNSNQFSAQSWDWVVFDEAAYIESLPLMLGMAKGMANCDITLSSTPSPKYTEFNNLYFSSIQRDSYFTITDFLWYDHPIFGEDVVWTQGNGFSIDDNNTDDKHKIRLLEMGFWRTSEAYEKHLKRYGYNTSTKIEMEAHMILPPQTAQ